jgi:hypothetical protein
MTNIVGDLIEVDRSTFQTFLYTKPGLHNWKVPNMIGFTDNAGVCRGCIVTKPEGSVFWLHKEEVWRKD